MVAIVMLTLNVNRIIAKKTDANNNATILLNPLKNSLMIAKLNQATVIYSEIISIKMKILA